MAPP
ncbi:hypothetical protein D023_2880A, partial [Vibrio parahaemolyticus 3256]|jgi:hypothetical protein